MSKKLLHKAAALCSMIALLGNMATSVSAEEITREKQDPVITITIGKQLDENSGKYEQGADINNNAWIDYGVETLGIKIQTTLLGGDAANYDSKLRLALTGAESLPDVFPVYNKQLIVDLIDSGQVQPIDEAIETLMPERLKELYAKFPDIFLPVTHEGQVYGLGINPSWSSGEVLIIRQDWLDKLGLEAPTTVEELEVVMKAFTEDDPDGNGKDDTYGLTYSGESYYTGWVSNSGSIFSAFTGDQVVTTWQLNDKDELEYGSLAPGNKEALAKMAEWHKNGYIFQEAATTNPWDAMGQYFEGKAGIIFGAPWVVTLAKDLEAMAPTAVTKAYPNLQRVDGSGLARQIIGTNDGFYMFNKDFEHMDAFFNYLDMMYDLPFKTGFENGGYLEDYDFDIVNGEVVTESSEFEPAKENALLPAKAWFGKNKPSLEYASQSMADIYNGVEVPTLAGVKRDFEENRNAYEAYAIDFASKDSMTNNKFIGAPTPTMQARGEQLKTLELQVFTNIIYGKQPLEAFDQFVKDWKAQGGDQITQEINEWYQSVK